MKRSIYKAIFLFVILIPTLFLSTVMAYLTNDVVGMAFLVLVYGLISYKILYIKKEVKQWKRFYM